MKIGGSIGLTDASLNRKTHDVLVIDMIFSISSKSGTLSFYCFHFYNVMDQTVRLICVVFTVQIIAICIFSLF